MYTNILGYPVFGGTKDELIDKIKNYHKVNIISGNPEILFNGTKNSVLYSNFTSKDSIIIPDGVGTVIASRIVKEPVKEKIAGIELMEEILRICENESKGVYLLGAKEEVLEECKSKLKEKFPKINIVGSHNGYFNIDDCDDIINNIKSSGAYALFVAMGSPKQEYFIIRNMNDLPCSIYMGVGGSFDVFAGKVNRAPKWMLKLGLEWLYRSVKEPWRFKRLTVIPKFLWKVFIHKDKYDFE